MSILITIFIGICVFAGLIYLISKGLEFLGVLDGVELNDTVKAIICLAILFITIIVIFKLFL